MSDTQSQSDAISMEVSTALYKQRYTQSEATIYIAQDDGHVFPTCSEHHSTSHEYYKGFDYAKEHVT